jgi:hypothetical protein
MVFFKFFFELWQVANLWLKGGGGLWVMNFERDDAKQFVLSSSGLVTYIYEKK